jgi:outer membrane protein OmpA-like peptidoglycan-associated protein
MQGRDLATYAAHQYVDVLRPLREDRSITLVCEIFGYKDEVKLVDYNDPSTTEGAYQDEHGAWVIPFTLERLQKGNISVMYNVTFYKDAVIMLPRSKPELDELVHMMNLNPNYKIKIHGHNNGTEKSIRIITLGNDRNYFNMARSLSKMGSAKELSRMRAEIVKSYLVDQGIDKNRIDTYAWGGTAMLMKPGTAAATRLNNRIEIEILSD